MSLQPLEVSAPHYPSVGCRVQVTSGGFHGENPEVWLEADALQEFINQLERLDQTRTGEAVLTAMIPGEFILRIKAADHLGHLLVAATVARDRLLAPGAVRVTDSATVNCELDPSALMDAVENFKDLYKPVEGRE